MRFNWNPDPSSYRSVICGSGFYLTHWGYVGSAQGLGCEAQVLWLQTKPRTDNSFLTDLWWRLTSLIRLRGVSSIPGLWRAKRASSSLLALLWHHWSIWELQRGILRPHFDGIRPCLVMNVVLVEETSMRGNGNWQVKHLRVKGWCSGRLWPDRTQESRWTVRFGRSSQEWATVCMSVSDILKKLHTLYVHARRRKKEVRQQEVMAFIWKTLSGFLLH